MKQRLLIVVNANWPTLPLKVNQLKESFRPKIEFEIDTIETHIGSIPFTQYGEEKRIDDAWLDANIVPMCRGYDVAAFVVPKSQWLSEKHWGFKLLGREIPLITILGDENEVFQTSEVKHYVSIFEENMNHELAHYFYGLTPEVPDATHDLVAKHGIGLWLQRFLEEWKPPVPREAEEANLFIRTLRALLSTFNLTKKEEEEIAEAIADAFPNPKPPVPVPIQSRISDLAHIMEQIECGPFKNSFEAIKQSGREQIRQVAGSI